MGDEAKGVYNKKAEEIRGENKKNAVQKAMKAIEKNVSLFFNCSAYSMQYSLIVKFLNFLIQRCLVIIAMKLSIL